jgi:hypothetical protein
MQLSQPSNPGFATDQRNQRHLCNRPTHLHNRPIRLCNRVWDIFQIIDWPCFLGSQMIRVFNYLKENRWLEMRLTPGLKFLQFDYSKVFIPILHFLGSIHWINLKVQKIVTGVMSLPIKLLRIENKSALVFLVFNQYPPLQPITSQLFLLHLYICNLWTSATSIYVGAYISLLVHHCSARLPSLIMTAAISQQHHFACGER